MLFFARAFINDTKWKIQGIHIRGTDVNGNVEFDTCLGQIFKDCLFEVNGADDRGVKANDDGSRIELHKCRFYNHTYNIEAAPGNGGWADLVVRDSLLDGNSVASSSGVQAGYWDRIKLIDCEFKNHTSDIRADQVTNGALIQLENCIYASTIEVDISVDLFTSGATIKSSDHDGSLGVLSEYNSWGSSGTGIAVIESDTGTVRSGGGAVSGKWC